MYIDKPQSFLELQGGPNEHNIGIGRATPNSHSGTSVTLNSTYWDIEDSEATTINDAPTGQVDYYSSPPPHYVSESEHEGHKSDCVHDEIAEHPRVISPFDSSPPLHICTPPNSTHFPLKTSNLATNIKAVSYSNQVNILEQYPQRELASSNPLLDPITHQRSNTSLQNCHVRRAPEVKSNGYRIPTGGTLV